MREEVVIQTFPVNPLEENCYVVHRRGAAECVVIDCGALFPDEQDAIRAYLDAHRLRPVAHLLTHGHFDHVFGAQFLSETYGVQPLLREEEVENYLGALPLMHTLIGRVDFPLHVPTQYATFRADDVLDLAGLHFQALPTPGHTPGGTCFLLKEDAEATATPAEAKSERPDATATPAEAKSERPEATATPATEKSERPATLFSGDTIFAESVGRCDFPGSSYAALVQSVRERLLPLPADTKVYPGHGPAFTMQQWTANRYRL